MRKMPADANRARYRGRAFEVQDIREYATGPPSDSTAETSNASKPRICPRTDARSHPPREASRLGQPCIFLASARSVSPDARLKNWGTGVLFIRARALWVVPSA